MLIDTIAACHPSDQEKLRRLGEMLCDVSSGRPGGHNPVTRDGLLSLVESLAPCVRDDLGQGVDADVLVDRLLAIADHWYGADVLAEGALAIIQAAPADPGFQGSLLAPGLGPGGGAVEAGRRQ